MLVATGPTGWEALSPPWSATLALLVYFAVRSRRIGLPEWAAFVMAVGVVSAAEIVLELVEYPTMYAGKFHYSAYYDTLAAMANSIVGAVIGAGVAVVVARRLASR